MTGKERAEHDSRVRRQQERLLALEVRFDADPDAVLSIEDQIRERRRRTSFAERIAGGAAL